MSQENSSEHASSSDPKPEARHRKKRSSGGPGTGRKVRFPDEIKSDDATTPPEEGAKTPDTATASTSSNTSEESTTSEASNHSLNNNNNNSANKLAWVVCEVPARDDYEQEEIEKMFFSRQEYQLSRSQAKVVSKESERYGFSKALQDTWTEKSSSAQEQLNQWCKEGHARRGLERWASPTMGEQRQQEQFQAVMAVLRAQDDMLARSAAMTTGGTGTSNSGVKKIDPEKLRRVSHKATKVSRHFARMMGKADSFAVAQMLREEDPQLLEALQFHNKSLAQSYATDMTADQSLAPSVYTTASTDQNDLCSSNNPLVQQVAAHYDSIKYQPKRDEDGLIDSDIAVDEVEKQHPSSEKEKGGSGSSSHDKFKQLRRFLTRKNPNSSNSKGSTAGASVDGISRVA